MFGPSLSVHNGFLPETQVSAVQIARLGDLDTPLIALETSRLKACINLGENILIRLGSRSAKLLIVPGTQS